MNFIRVGCLVLSLMVVTAAFGGQMLFDFESSQDITAWKPWLRTWAKDCSRFSATDKWSTSGKQSLHLRTRKWDETTMATQYYPGMICAYGDLPVRDWSNFKYLCIDVCVNKNTVNMSVLVQRSRDRQDRVDTFFLLKPGQYRLWLSVPKHIGGSNIDRLKAISSIEFFFARCPTDVDVYIDTIRFVDKFNPTFDRKTQRRIANELLAGAADAFVAKDSVTSPMVFVENMKPDEEYIADKRAEVIQQIKKKMDVRLAADEIERIVSGKFEDYGYGALVTGADRRVPIEGKQGMSKWDDKCELELLGGQRRSKQLVVFPSQRKSLEDMTFEVSDFKDAATGLGLPASTLTVDMVGYVSLPLRQDRMGKDYAPGWYPDPIMKIRKPVSIAAPRAVQPLLLTASIPYGTKAGLYQGTITIKPEGKKALSVPVSLKVLGVDMPRQPRLIQLHGISSRPQLDSDFYLSYRINPHMSGQGNIYGQPKKALDIERLKELCAKGMNAFNLHRISKHHVEKYCKTDAQLDKYADFIINKYPDSYMKKLVAAGLADKAYFYGFDEYHVTNEGDAAARHRFTRVLKRIRQHASKYGVRVVTTARGYTHPKNFELPVDVWIPIAAGYDPAVASLYRKKGRDVFAYTIWWEIHCQPSWTNAMLWTLYGKGAPGWLYYNFNAGWLKKNQVLGDDPMTDWVCLSPNAYGFLGTGSLVYMDKDNQLRPSLRLVNCRDGLFDYDLLSILEDQVRRLEQVENKLAPQEQVYLETAKQLVRQKPWMGLVNQAMIDRHSEELHEAASAAMDKARSQAMDLLEKLVDVPVSKTN